MSNILNNNNVQKHLVKIKEAMKTDYNNNLEVGKIYFLEIENGSNYSDRRINILDDYFNPLQYYYNRDGVTFNRHFEILTSNISGGALKKKRKSKKRYNKKYS